METLAKAPKFSFEQNFPICKTNQKQVNGTKWGSVGTGFPPIKWGRVGTPLKKLSEVGKSGTVQVERPPPLEMGRVLNAPLSTYKLVLSTPQPIKPV